MKKITSIAELSTLARTKSNYFRLAITAARNLGSNPTSLDEAIRWLSINAYETSEEGVVDEINNCIDLV